MAKKKASQLNPNAWDRQKCSLLEEYMNYTTGSKEVLTTLSIERLARELVAEVRGNEQMLKVNEFLERRGINRRTWNGWLQKYEILSEAYNFALMVLGNRREIGVLTRKFDSGSTSLLMPLYDEDWRDALALKAKFSNPEGMIDSGPKFIIMEKFPDSPLVPTRPSVVEDKDKE